MSFRDAISSVLSQYATFSGRARRSEYWWWTLATSVVFTVLYVAGLALLFAGGAADPGASELGAGAVGGFLVLGVLGLLSLALLLPSLGVTVRRLHDTGRSGWWYLISFVPGIGPVVLLVFEVLDSSPGANAYGPSPKEADAGYGYGAPGAHQAHRAPGYGR